MVQGKGFQEHLPQPDMRELRTLYVEMQLHGLKIVS